MKVDKFNIILDYKNSLFIGSVALHERQSGALLTRLQILSGAFVA
jgi:hypothetical protein